jgi:hypothetical protein
MRPNHLNAISAWLPWALEAQQQDPPHIHADDIAPLRSWTTQDIADVLTFLGSRTWATRLPLIIVPVEAHIPHPAVPETLADLHGMWIVEEEGTPEIYLFDDHSICPGHALQLKQLTNALAPLAGGWRAFLIHYHSDALGSSWQVMLVPAPWPIE